MLTKTSLEFRNSRIAISQPRSVSGSPSGSVLASCSARSALSPWRRLSFSNSSGSGQYSSVPPDAGVCGLLCGCRESSVCRRGGVSVRFQPSTKSRGEGRGTIAWEMESNGFCAGGELIARLSISVVAVAAGKLCGGGGGAMKELCSLLGEVGGELMKMLLLRRRASEEVGFIGDGGMVGG